MKEDERLYEVFLKHPFGECRVEIVAHIFATDREIEDKAIEVLTQNLELNYYN